MRNLSVLALLLVAVLIPPACARAQDQGGPTSQASPEETGQPLADPPPAGYEVATFAGGCFWCVEGAFDGVPGVLDAISGYTGGQVPHPTYHQVGRGGTGHAESVRVIYDPSVITYEALLDIYWHQIDPTDDGGQFVDRGDQYRPTIFVHNAAQRQAAEASRDALAASGVFEEPIAVPIEDAGDFWVAEDYHQNYHSTNSDHYHSYRAGSGRDPFIQAHWGDAAAH